MAFFKKNAMGASPSLDASLGLIYRLNNLWTEVDKTVMTGDYKKWNMLLDRVYSNLLFQNPMEIIKDDKTHEIVAVRLSSADKKCISFLDQEINKSFQYIHATDPKKKPLTFNKYRYVIYKHLFNKEVFLRKKMQELKLYLKVSDSDPSKAIYS